MNSFQSKFPAFYALIALVAMASKDTANAVTSKDSVLAKLLQYENLVPLAMQLYPVAGDIVAESKAMQPADMVAAAESLVADLGFSSEKAQAVIQASFVVAEKAVDIVPAIQNLVAVIKA